MGILLKRPFQLLVPNLHHMLAFAASVDNSGNVNVSGVSDAVFTLLEDFFIAPTDLEIIYAAGLNCANSRVKIIAASLASFYPQIQPLEGGVAPTGYTKVMNFVEHPINILAEESFGAVANNSGGTHDIQVLMGVTTGSEKVAIFPGEGADLRWIRATATLSNTKNTWKSVSITFDDTLPAGTYDVYGMIVVEDSGGTSAVRLVFPGQTYRPGCLVSSDTVVPNPIFEGSLGLWGSFASFAAPNIESLSASDGTPTAEIYILVNKN